MSFLKTLSEFMFFNFPDYACMFGKSKYSPLIISLHGLCLESKAGTIVSVHVYALLLPPADRPRYAVQLLFKHLWIKVWRWIVFMQRLSHT